MCIQKDKVAFQNLFTLGLIALGLCFLREPIELGIFGKGNYNFPKLAKRLGQIKKNKTFDSLPVFHPVELAEAQMRQRAGWLDRQEGRMKMAGVIAGRGDPGRALETAAERDVVGACQVREAGL